MTTTLSLSLGGMPHANRATDGCPNHLLGAPRPAFVKAWIFDQDGQVVANAVVATVRAGGTAGDVVFSNLPHGTDVRQDPKVRLAYPNYFSLDMRVSKDVQVNLQHAVRLSFTVRNLTNHFNPLEVHSNLADPQYGRFFGNYDRKFLLDFDFLF